MIRSVVLLMLSSFYFSCKSGNALFGNKSYHEDYSEKIKNAGLDKSAMGSMWLKAAESALSHPITIKLPYKESGYFSAATPRAIAMKFQVKRGQQIIIRLDKKPEKFILFADLWKADQHISLIYSFDTTRSHFTYDIEKDGQLLLRLQPELLQSFEYELSILTGPSLRFPVSGKTTSVGSFWGDKRDAGARNHEGIDIFAPKRTPAVAAAEGRVTSVTQNRLGGKVVFLRPTGKNITLYYAHLDEQSVSTGQLVKEGDRVGMVGNTGNAATTPSHLHFGIYSSEGAIDPLPFVDPVIKKPEEAGLSVKDIQEPFRLTAKFELNSKPDEAILLTPQTILFPRSVSSKELNAELPDGRLVHVPLTITMVAKSLKKQNLKADQGLLDNADANAARKTILLAGSAVSVYGYFHQFAFVKSGELSGWILLSALN